jgi:hypothetical protein
MSHERKNQPEPVTLEQVLDQAREVILRDGGHAPTVIADGSHAAVSLALPELGDTHDERRFQMFAAGFMLGHSRRLGALRQAFFVSEGWMSVAEGEIPPRVPPSEDPNRKEVLFVSSLKLADGKASMVIFEMIRDSEGELFEIKPLSGIADQVEETEVESPLLDAFAAGFSRGVE